MEDTSPWTPAGEPVSTGHLSSTLMVVEGQSFYLSAANGDVVPGLPQGLFVGDTRFVDRAELKINGQSLELLATSRPDAFAAILVLRPRNGDGAPSRDVLVVRRRYLGLGYREDIELRNYGPEPLSTLVELELGADFADLFTVKEGRRPQPMHRLTTVDSRLLVAGERDGVWRAVELSFHGPGRETSARGATWRVSIPAGGTTTLCWDATVSLGGSHLSRHTVCGEQPERMEAVVRARSWEQEMPVLESPDERLRQATAQTLDDLGALRVFDPTVQRRPVIAAGAPWFMTLFGRDSLIAAWMSLPLGLDLPLGVLETLAALQGQETNDERDEQPGRILHELRFTRASTLSLLAGEPYYGSADSAPLFVMLLGEVACWGAPAEAVRALLPAADAALAWIDEFGDRDGDGFVEYLRATPSGLANQGWKDSWDGVRYADGRVADAPLALCEVQAYVYAAYRARAALARWLGEPSGIAARYDDRAAGLRRAFNESFWMPGTGTFALALDAGKSQVDSVTSNPGHCLWTGIVDDELAPQVATSLVSAPMWSGWGIRTLSATNGGYNPMSYHCGSVWPHDTAIAVAGLSRYGLDDEARLLASGLLDTAAAGRGALPELLCGVDRSDVEVPVAYPTSCQPQAWAAAAPLLLLRSLLGLEPDAPGRRLSLRAAALPSSWRPLRWAGIHVGDHRIDVTLDRASVSAEGAPATWKVDATA
jgi:glycogen debranching enzyme